MRKLISTALLALTLTASARCADAAPKKPATASDKLAKARAKVTRATKSSRSAITRADAAIERCERAIVDLCQVEHGVTGGQCEDAALSSQFAACHTPSRALGWAGKGKVIPAEKRADYEACLDEVDTDDADASAERCAGEPE